MAGVGPMIAILLLGATPGSFELDPGGAKADVRKRASQPIASVVDVGRKWGVVTSVRRSPERNRAVGGAPNSFHLYGRAIDIARRPGVRHADIDAAYRKAGYRLIESLDEGDHSHFAFGLPGSSEKPEAVQLAAAAAPQAACAADTDATSAERRRPDRWDGCADSSEPRPRLRPIQPAP